MEGSASEHPEKRRIAKSAPFILSFVFFERYTSAGVASILVLFLHLKLGYDQHTSTAIYHTYVFMAYLLPLVGSVIADSWLGQFKTLFWMSLVYSIGAISVAVGTIDALNLPITLTTFVGLIIITIGAGCTKPSAVTFGGDQYKSHELKSIALYFSMHYFAFNSGSVVSRFINPILRADVKCFGGNDCYPLAFGIPGIMMLAAALSLLIGRKCAICVEASGKTLLSVCSCIWNAVSLKLRYRSEKSKQKNHWLDYSEEKYGKAMVIDTKMILNVLTLFPPLIIFWALYCQQGSRWIFQATRMDGKVGNYIIKPDQFPVVNPIMVLILIPTLEFVLNPMLAKVGIKTPLQKATLGGVLGGIAFILSAIVELNIKNGLHMMWLLPQYFTMTLGETLVTVPLGQFSHTEAPDSMKSVLQAFRMLNIAAGNLIVVVVAGARLVESQFIEFLIFAGLMFFTMLIFGWLCSQYKPATELQKELKSLAVVDDSTHL